MREEVIMSVLPQFQNALRRYVEAAVHHCLSTLQADSFKRLEGELGSDLANQVRQRAASCDTCSKRLGKE